MRRKRRDSMRVEDEIGSPDLLKKCAENAVNEQLVGVNLRHEIVHFLATLFDLSLRRRTLPRWPK